MTTCCPRDGERHEAGSMPAPRVAPTPVTSLENDRAPATTAYVGQLAPAGITQLADAPAARITPVHVAQPEDDAPAGITPMHVAQLNDAPAGITPVHVAQLGDAPAGITPVRVAPPRTPTPQQGITPRRSEQSRRALACLAACAALLVTATACRTPTTSAGDPLSPKDQAHLLLQKGDGRAAVELLEKLHAEQPADLAIARMLAEAHVKAGSADALLARLATRDTAVSHYMQGLVRFGRAADATGPAVAEFRRAVELSPAEAELHYRLGLALLESEQYDDALASLKKATSLAPDRSSWSLALAKALYRTGDSKGAVSAIRTVVTSAPSPADVKTARALMDQLADPFAGFPRAARPQLEQAIQWLEVADVPQQAIAQLEELLRDYPDQPAVHTLLGVAWARLDDAGRAVDELKRAIELAPDDGKNHLYLAELYVTRQRPKVAEEHYQKAIDRNPVLDEAWFKLGDLALERQDLSTARRDFEIASRLTPESVPARGKLALVHQLEGNWPAADRELRAVLEREPDNLEFMLRLGVLHTERFTKAKSSAERDEAAKEASTWLQKVLDAQPENALASRALERLKVR